VRAGGGPRLRAILLAALPGLLLGPASPAPAHAAMSARQRAAILAPTTDFTKAERWEELSGGTATNRTTFTRDAFSEPSANLSFEERADFSIGNGIFRRNWVIAPSSTQAADGLGPLYNARACQLCHLKDGRGHPPTGPDDSGVSMFLRLSVPPATEAERELLASHRANVIPDPTYGGQLQDLAIPGHLPEGRMAIDYEDIPVELAGGETVHLRAPSYRIADPAYGPFDPKTMMISPRMAPPMIGLGLLEAIAPEDILAHADPDDADHDGISGRPNQVWSEAEHKVMLGRFGWKAGEPSIDQQGGHALAGDVGIGNPIQPAAWGDCTAPEAKCRAAPNGNSPQYDDLEAPRQVMDQILFYSRNLAVPARRDVDDPTVLEGKRLFYTSGCTGCHRPKFATRRAWPVEALAGQLIWPYTDLLLHDMGEGLADHRPEGEATGREWRTPPLWGIGLTGTVNGHTFFLHDGRARNLTEAILWHGGEAQGARDVFAKMSKAERDALLAFLKSL
jgi:CxxC motif-containing protein (DUF1111 family)